MKGCEMGQEHEIRFVDELPRKASSLGSTWAPVIEKLKADPGRWALVRTGSANQCRAVAALLKDRHSCETAIRTVEGVIGAYARWPKEQA